MQKLLKSTSESYLLLITVLHNWPCEHTDLNSRAKTNSKRKMQANWLSTAQQIKRGALHNHATSLPDELHSSKKPISPHIF